LAVITNNRAGGWRELNASLIRSRSQALRSTTLIAGAHTIIFAEDAEKARTFLRDVLGFEGVDAGDGWLIFALPPGEIAVHPGSGWGRGPGHHVLFFMCHDIEQTIEELKGKGVEFVSPIEDEGWGRIAQFKIPGAGEIGLYEPRHPSPLEEFTPSA
jgi:catechol 2,3-dioxygenase-like lactoylglutathione lyase family enzyme